MLLHDRNEIVGQHIRVAQLSSNGERVTVVGAQEMNQILDARLAVGFLNVDAIVEITDRVAGGQNLIVDLIIMGDGQGLDRPTARAHFAIRKKSDRR